ncbi:MAG: ABC transporter permease [Thermoproteota archaeon]|nr:MAG: ABC transporter permease [Candidatus Korarchaeota archaeon]RLG54723.1 MAG: ABC transporter permease [Candidatus Korarchaeota archaeon]
MKPLRSIAANAVALLLFTLAWHATTLVVRSPFYPKPLDVLKAFCKLALEGDIEGYSLGLHIGVSLLRVISGFLFACATGIPLGLAMGLYRPAYESTRSIIEPVRFIPPIAWIPLAIVLLRGFSRYVFLIWLGAFFPVFINTLASIHRVSQVHVELAKVFGGDRSFILAKVVIPSIMPEVLAGMRIGLGVGWMCIVAAEMIGGEMVGLGSLILKYAELLRVPEVICGMVVIGVVGLLMNELFLAAERRLFKWRREVVV